MADCSQEKSKGDKLVMSTTTTDTQPTTGRGRGFASLSIAERKRVASLGGKKAHTNGTAHKWNSKTAAEAGRKGGTISRRKPKPKN